MGGVDETAPAGLRVPTRFLGGPADRQWRPVEVRAGAAPVYPAVVVVEAGGGVHRYGLRTFEDTEERVYLHLGEEKALPGGAARGFDDLRAEAEPEAARKARAAAHRRRRKNPDEPPAPRER